MYSCFSEFKSLKLYFEKPNYSLLDAKGWEDLITLSQSVIHLSL